MRVQSFMFINDVARNTPSETSALSGERRRAGRPGCGRQEAGQQVRESDTGRKTWKKQRQLDASILKPLVGEDANDDGNVGGENGAQEGEVVDLGMMRFQANANVEQLLW